MTILVVGRNNGGLSMSKDEYGKKYCANCVSHNDCIFLNQGSKCMCVHDAEDAWEDCQKYMIEKACKWMDTNLPNTTITKLFKKAMEDIQI